MSLLQNSNKTISIWIARVPRLVLFTVISFDFNFFPFWFCRATVHPSGFLISTEKSCARMSDNLIARLAHRILGGNESSQPDIENAIPQPSKAVHPQLQAHADYGGRHDFGMDERLIIFRHLTGITSHPSMIQSQLRPGGRAAPNLGIYARVVKNEASAKKGYENFSWLINGCLGLQIIVAASLTALGAADASHSAITALGAINTVMAGLLTFLKGSGLPNRLSYYHTQWKQIREFIEQRERDFSRPGCDLDVHGVVGMIETMYEEVKKDMEASTPDRFAGSGMLRKQAENASKDAGFNLQRVGAGALGEKIEDIQAGFGGEGPKESPAEFDSTLGNNAHEGFMGEPEDNQSGFRGHANSEEKDRLAEYDLTLGKNVQQSLKGKFKELESGLAGRAKDLVMGHIAEVAQVKTKHLQTHASTITGNNHRGIFDQSDQAELLDQSDEDRVKG
jgi:hypothetical protein